MINIDNLIQTRVERSIFEAIRLVLVAEGYLPDITAAGKYAANAMGQQEWQTDLKSIAQAKEFAAEVFGAGSSQDKGKKAVPRISILPGRYYEGELGAPIGGSILKNTDDPNNYVRVNLPLESSTLSLEIVLSSGNAKQSRFLNAVLSLALGTKRYLSFYDNPNEKFFIQQRGYYESPDLPEGIDEQSYIFEVTDLYRHQTESATNVPLINEITMETYLAQGDITIQPVSGVVIGPYIADGKLFIDLSGIDFQN